MLQDVENIDIQKYVNSGDLILLSGAMLSDTNMPGWAAVPSAATIILASTPST